MPRVDLGALLAAALADHSEESAFFRALPDGQDFVHAPKSDDHRRVRLIQFQRPTDGLMVLPVFTSRSKAEAAAGNAARIIELSGRELADAAPGATWMLDPNDESCTLFPQEIASLMLHGSLDCLAIDKEAITSPSGPLAPTSNKDAEEFLSTLFRNLGIVHSAYLFRELGKNDETVSHILAIAVHSADAEIAARATLAALHGGPEAVLDTVALLDFDPSEGPPEFVSELGAEPFYRRRER